MEIIGRGFLARHLRPIADAHPGVVLLAAGVSAAGDSPQAEFGREADLLYETIGHCEERGKRLVLFSTAATGMYSLRGEAGRESGPVRPATAYGRHKLALEAVLASSRLDYLILRLAHVVGPHQPAHQLLPSLTRQVASGAVRIYRGARRDLIDVSDVVHIVDGLLSTGVAREVVNVASGRAAPVEEIVGHIETCLGVRAEREFLDAAGAAQPVSIGKLRRLLPSVQDIGFGPDYHRAVLDKYVRNYTEQTAPSYERSH
ncbi:nucleoside-diphosphate-sugar epimerase [Streptomyces griseochromogenes]|uniref:NDP-hexose 4-ketoreductase n=1 Tax=Streptomyces griseochromogenes TaxID=68214 RepID=A0A1B1BB20_9ACTN|nr:NAD-dependent epimerase/dehydratase family protein [Streptomyces griseochromogenes]ANP56018.1 NDP-hexose 4-ketoreductase [Streptomyces griseochromogenes]MBP2051131.1 nucleoside-diphosphate-sugar epimerase [Streptomyces griseochromogenes]